MTSASSMARRAAARMATCSWYSGSSSPGESVKMYWVSSRVSRPTTEAGGLGLGGDDGEVFANQSVQEGGFPNIRSPCQHDCSAPGHKEKATASRKDVKEESSRKNVTENRS